MDIEQNRRKIYFAAIRRDYLMKESMELEQETVGGMGIMKDKLEQRRHPRTIVQIATSAVIDGRNEKFRTTALCSDGTV